MRSLFIYLLSSFIISTSLLAGWIEAEKIVEGVGDGSLSFGYSVDVDGNYIIVGAPDEDDSSINGGAAYVFKKNASGEFEYFFKFSGWYKGALGTDVAISDAGGGHVIVAVGEPNYEFYNAKTSSTVYNDVINIYKLNDAGTSFEALRSIYDNNGTGLGTSVDIANITEMVDTQSPLGIIPSFRGYVIVAGAPEANKAYTYFYDYYQDAWDTIELSEGTTLDKFGYSVAIKNKHPFIYGAGKVIIGAPDDDIYDSHRGENLHQRGSVHIYDLNGTFANNDFSWINRAELTQGIPQVLIKNTHLNEYTHFGKAVDISGDRAIAGASKISISSDLSIMTPAEARIFALSNAINNTWIDNGTLVQPILSIFSSRYASAVALSNSKTAIVGAPNMKSGTDINDPTLGAIFTYEYDDTSAHWDETGRLLGKEIGHFGTSVDYVGTRPLAGNPSKDTISLLKSYNATSPALLIYLLN